MCHVVYASEEEDAAAILVKVQAHRAAHPEWEAYLHEPPDSRLAKAKRSCLKPPSKRNPNYDPWRNAEGHPITVESCEDVIETMVYSGCWKRVMGESCRQVAAVARSCVMEFVVPTHSEHERNMGAYVREINLAGYTHWSLCDTNGWAPFELPGQTKGYGREVVDYERLADWHAERAFSIPMPHHAGDGWICRAQHYTQADYPDADEWGPQGISGPRWSAVA